MTNYKHQYEQMKLMVDKYQNEIVPGLRKLLAEREPVRHGRWVDKPTGAYGRYQSWCTACGKHSGIGGIESNRHKPYCPNCGAKMRGDTDE